MTGPRILKKNYTSTGVGVWRVVLLPDAFIECKEAATNETQVFQNVEKLCDYLQPAFFEQVSRFPRYFRDRQGLLDVPYSARVSEGEVRVFFVYDEPKLIVKKTPKPNDFSETLFSGADYQFFTNLNEWKELIDFTCWGLWTIKSYFPNNRFPLIWSIDSIPNTKLNGDKGWVLSDVNAASVGFTSPEIVSTIVSYMADELTIEFEQDEIV